MISCKNCNHTIEGNYCSNCGQSAHIHSLGFTYFLHEIQHSLLHVDKGILFTTKELFSRPGRTINEYIAGKRVNHFKPFAYLFIMSSLYVLISHLLKLEDFDTKISFELSPDTVSSKADSQKTQNFILTVKDIIHWIRNHYAYSNLMILPVLSLASFLAFKKRGYNYFEHLILNTFLAGQRTVFFLLFLPIFYFFKGSSSSDTIELIKNIFNSILIFWTFNQFFHSNKWTKNLLLTAVFIGLIGLFMLAIILVGLVAIGLLVS